MQRHLYLATNQTSLKKIEFQLIDTSITGPTLQAAANGAAEKPMILEKIVIERILKPPSTRVRTNHFQLTMSIQLQGWILADLVITSTQYEIESQYQSYNAFKEANFMVIPPGINDDLFYPFYRQK